MAALSAALSQIYIFKPVDVGVSGVFLLLFVFGLGKMWEFVFPFPKTDREEEGQHPFMRKVWEIVNPRPFGLKEVCFGCHFARYKERELMEFGC
jgi:hypothetical protein